MLALCSIFTLLSLLEMVTGQDGTPCTPSSLEHSYAMYGNGTRPHPSANYTTLSNCQEYLVRGGCATSGFYIGPFSQPLTVERIHYFRVRIPHGTKLAVFTTSGGSGNLQLYVRRNALPASIPGLTDYNVTPGTTKLIITQNPAAGDYYALLRPSNQFEGVTFKACFCRTGVAGCCRHNIDDMKLYYVFGAATALILLVLIILIIIVFCCLSCKLAGQSSESRKNAD